MSTRKRFAANGVAPLQLIFLKPLKTPGGRILEHALRVLLLLSSP